MQRSLFIFNFEFIQQWGSFLNKGGLRRILASIFLYLLFLEIFARVGGFVYLKIQDYVNYQSIASQGEFRIMCLGDSITAYGGNEAYPRQMERLLNASGKGNKFSVINKGIPSLTTSGVVGRLEGFLNEFKPNMVVMMVGAIDGDSFGEGNVKKEAWWQNIRLFKLLDLIAKRFRKSKELRSAQEQRNSLLLDKIEQQAKRENTSEAYAAAAAFFRAAHNVNKEKAMLDQSLTLNPGNLDAATQLGEYYKRIGQYDKAIVVLEAVISMGIQYPQYRNDSLDMLGQIYSLLGEDKQAEKIFLELLNINPAHPMVWGYLAQVYLMRQDHTGAIKLFEQQLKVNPKADFCYGKLAVLYRLRGQEQKALELLSAGIRELPGDPSIHRDYALFLIQAGQHEMGLEYLAKSITLDSNELRNIHLDMASPLLASYDQLTKEKIIRQWRSIPGVKDFTISKETHRSYQRITDILKKRNVPLVIVQYPMLSILPLKQILSGNQEGIIFIENKDNFENAIKQGAYEDYFIDHFGGNFGHCTPKGNFILANRIVEVIKNHPALKGLKGRP